MSGISDLFKADGTIAQFMLWNVLTQLLAPVLNPVIAELGIDVNQKFPIVPLSPSDAANLVARGFETEGTGKQIASFSGTSGENFDRLVDLAKHAPDLGAAIAALQRGYIPAGSDDPATVSFHGALTEAGIREEWFPVLDKLVVQIPTVAEVMNAWLEGQITEDEARTRYLAAGGDPTWFQTSYDANGEAPTPVQALEMLNRGLIPEEGTGPDSISYHQAFLEGPWRNKWFAPFLALRNYLPPPRTVTAMYHSGQLTHDQAAHYLTVQGLDPDLVVAYLSASSSTKTLTDKVLAKSDILALYKDKLLTRADAQTHLEALKYSASDANLILEISDLSAIKTALTAGVARLRTLFLAHKITEQDAQQSLVTLGIPAAQATQIIDTWQLTAVQETKTLTVAQIEGGWYYDVITTADAIDQIMALGYDETDAWILLTIKNKDPIKGSPLKVVPKNG